LIGTIYFRKYRVADSIGEYELATRFDPNFAIAYSNQANVLREQGMFADAAKKYEKAIALDEHLAAAHEGLGDTWKAQGKLEAAKTEYAAADENYRTAIRHDPVSANLLLEHAVALKARGKIHDAISLLRRALDLDQTHHVAYYHMGLAWRQEAETNALNKEKKDELLKLAITAFRTTIALDSRFPDVHNELGRALRRNGDLTVSKAEYQMAIIEYTNAVTLDPRDAMAYNKLGRILRETGNRDKAVPAYDKAIAAVDGKYDRAYANRGLAHFELGNYEAAASDLSRFLERYPDDIYRVLWLYLANAHSVDKPTAVAKLTASAAKVPHEWPYRVVELYLDRAKPEDIRAAAGGSAGNLCEAEFYIGEWHLLQGDRLAARQALQYAKDNCQPEFIEYSGAQAELARLDTSAVPEQAEAGR
jgi:lipoprotein NlpI